MYELKSNGLPRIINDPIECVGDRDANFIALYECIVTTSSISKALIHQKVSPRYGRKKRRYTKEFYA